VGRVGDQLEVIAAKGVLTTAAVEYIREHRAALLAALTPPSATLGPPSVVIAAVEARSLVLRNTGLSRVEAERQAAEELLPLAEWSVHESARCDFHGCVQRRLPDSDLYRCPACVPGAFAQRSAG
jgi:hypothetical protein